VTDFLIELYVPRSASQGIARDVERVRAAAAQQTRDGQRVRYLSCILVPEDETCFLLFEACSADALRETARIAELPVEHFAEAIASNEGWQR
jgi:hypothetical protein